jgi:hypothetical protein
MNDEWKQDVEMAAAAAVVLEFWGMRLLSNGGFRLLCLARKVYK